MAYDFKKEDKVFYSPKTAPSLVDVPAMTFVAVAGSGDPNAEGGAYKQAVELLYTFSYTVKMSKKGDWQPDGYFDFVVPPLEGLWWNGAELFDDAGISDKASLSWVSLIRQPDFVTPDAFGRLCSLAAAKKPELAFALDGLRLVRFSEGECAQVLHKGTYDDEPETIARLGRFIADQGLSLDIGLVGDASPREVLDAFDCDGDVPRIRLHHEIYLGDPRRAKPRGP